LYASPNVIRMIKTRSMRWVAHIACMGVVRIVYATLIGNAEMTITLGRPRHRWEDNIRLDLRETGWEGMDWIHLAQNRNQQQTLMNMVMNLQVP